MVKYLQRYGSGMLPLRGKGDLLVTQNYAQRIERPTEEVMDAVLKSGTQSVLVEVDRASFSTMAWVTTFDELKEVETLSFDREYFLVPRSFTKNATGL